MRIQIDNNLSAPLFKQLIDQIKKAQALLGVDCSPAALKAAHQEGKSAGDLKVCGAKALLAAGLAALGEATFFLAAVFVAVAFFTAGLVVVFLAAGFATFDFGVAAFADLVEGAFFFAVME